MLQPHGREAPVGAAMSNVLEEPVGQCDLDQRSFLCINVGLEQGPISLHIAYPREARQG
jgi:hypothetical protein